MSYLEATLQPSARLVSSSGSSDGCFWSWSPSCSVLFLQEDLSLVLWAAAGTEEKGVHVGGGTGDPRQKWRAARFPERRL